MATPEPVAHAADLALVRAVIAKDRAAGDRLAVRLGCIGRFLRTRGRRFCSGLSDADLLDIGQTVITRILEKLSDYEGRAAIESWVFAFCEGEMRNVVRRRQRNSVRAQELDDASIAAPSEDPIEDHGDLLRCMDRLPSLDLQMVRYKHYDGLRLADIAARMKTNLNTIKSRYSRALSQLRHCLDRNDDKATS